MKVRGRLFLAAAAAALFVACGDDPTAPDVAPVDRIEILPATLALTVGDTVRLVATPRSADGASVARPVTWSSDTEATATVTARSAQGVAVVLAVAPGVAEIRATAAGQEKRVAVTVSQAPTPVASVTLEFDAPRIEVGDVVIVRARPRSADGTLVEARTVQWTASDELAVSLTPVGDGSAAQLRARALGPVVIRAEVDGVVADTSVQVHPRAVPVDRVALSPADTTLAIGASFVLEAVPYAADNSVLTGRPVLWSSSNAAVASVAADGTITARAAGVARIGASVGGIVAEATVRVRAPDAPIGFVVVRPAIRGLWVGMPHHYGEEVQVLATNGLPLEGRSVTWSVADPTIASIAADGILQALRPGHTRVRATSGGVTGEASVVVYALPGERAVYDLTWDWWDGLIHLAPSVGTETVRDSTGASHNVNLFVTGGTLTIDDSGPGTTYERVLKVEGWLHGAGEPVRVVERELIDRGDVGIVVLGETGYNLISETTPGVVNQAVVTYHAGHLLVREAVGGAVRSEYMYRLRP